MPVVAEAILNGLYDGSKHMIWTQYSIPGGPGPEALYYARSVDNGDTWSDPVLVVNGPVTWSRILGFGDNVIHIVWQEFRSGRPVIRHQFSQDSGVSWSPIATISNFENALGHPSITIDPVGQLHIIQILNEIGDELDLKHWVWDGERWITSDGADLGTSREDNNIESAVVASILGELNVVYSGKISTESVVGLHNDLLSTYRTVTLPDTLPSFTPALTPLPTELPAPTPELTVTSIPTPTIAVVPTPEPDSDAGTAQGPINITGLALAFGGALAIIIIILFVVFRLRGNII
jgi:hypothetical protein